MPYLLSIFMEKNPWDPSPPHPQSPLVSQPCIRTLYLLPGQLLEFFQVLHQPSTSTICQRCDRCRSQSHHFAPRVLWKNGGENMFLLSLRGITRVITSHYPPTNISNLGKRKFIDSKVPAGRGYVSSLEGTLSPIIMEVENDSDLKETHLGGTHFSTLWEEEYITNLNNGTICRGDLFQICYTHFSIVWYLPIFVDSMIPVKKHQKLRSCRSFWGASAVHHLCFSIWKTLWRFYGVAGDKEAWLAAINSLMLTSNVSQTSSRMRPP